MHRHPRRSRTVTTVLAAAVLTALSLPAATASVDPGTGPTAGGTTVSGTVGVTVVDVDAAWFHTLAVGSDGLVYAWGRNSAGELGDGSTTSSTIPVQAATPEGLTFTAVAAGLTHSLALASDGTAYAWGADEAGQLGDGSDQGSTTPVAVSMPAGVTFTAIDAGDYHSIALGSDGQVYAWGNDSYGQVGTGETLDRVPEPRLVPMPAGTTFTAVAAAGDLAFALTADGQLYAMGYNNVGQLGDGTTTDAHAPVLVDAPDGVTFTAVSAGFLGTVALAADGSVYSWGSEITLGTGAMDVALTPVEVPLPGGARATAVTIGLQHVLVLTVDGSVYSWGMNWSGPLGDGTTTSSYLPVRVGTDQPFVTVSAGGYGSFALDADGHLWAWGANDAGQLGDGEVRAAQTTPVDITTVQVDAVLFGETAGADLTSQGEAWSVLSPAHVCGTVPVRVQYTQLGRAQTAVVGEFTFGSAPVVTGQPASTQVAAGSAATLTAGATADPVADVQWQQATQPDGAWTDVPAGTDPTLVVTPDTTTSYRAVFTTCLGTAVSEAATVTVDAVVPPDADPTVPGTDPTEPGTDPSEPGTDVTGPGTTGSGTTDGGTAAAADAPSGSALAITGSDLLLGGATAAGVLALGAVLVLTRRRMADRRGPDLR